MDRKFLIIIGAVVVAAIAAVAAFVLVTGPGSATLSHVEDLHMKMSASSLGELEGIIRGSAEPYTRERAVSVYTDIAMRTGNDKRALGFLKDVAIKEQDTDVRTSAYTNYYLIQERSAIPPATTVGVTVTGDIRPGNDIRVLLSVTSSRGSNLTSVGMMARGPAENYTSDGSPVVIDANAGKGALTNVVLTPSNRIRRPLPANITVEYPYTVSIKGPGKVMLKSITEVRYDELDYDTVRKDIYLDVTSSGGTYRIEE